MQACRPTSTEGLSCRRVDQPILEMSLMFPYSSSKNSMSTYSTPELFLMLCAVRRQKIELFSWDMALSIYVRDCHLANACAINSSLIFSVKPGNEASTVVWEGKRYTLSCLCCNVRSAVCPQGTRGPTRLPLFSKLANKVVQLTRTL